MQDILPEQRLDILRAADDDRTWHSLDDKRVCAVCDRIFSGRQVEINGISADASFSAAPVRPVPQR